MVVKTVVKVMVVEINGGQSVSRPVTIRSVVMIAVVVR